MTAPTSARVNAAVDGAGLAFLPRDPDIDRVAAALERLRDGLRDASPLERELARRVAERILADRGMPHAGRLVAAALAPGDHEKPAPRDTRQDGTATGDREKIGDLLAAGRPILESPRPILDLVGEYVHHAGFAGDVRAPQLVYLALTSRLLQRPANLFLIGPSAGGKNYTVRAPLPLFPPEAFYAVAGTSPLGLIYSEESFAHRVVIIAEAAGFAEDGIGASLLRALAWDAELAYDTVIDGAAVHLQKPGPTGLITTGTRRLEPELATRLWTVPVPDDPSHTRAVLRASAEEAAGELTTPPDTTPWVAAQRWLAVAGERQVAVPFAKSLAGLVPAHEVRMRRDFRQLLALIQAHALLHQRRRETDVHGRIVATLEDYAVVRGLVEPIFAASLSGGLTPAVRDTVEAVAALTAGAGSTATVTQVAERLGLTPSGAWHRVRVALDGRWLVNEEARPRQPARLRVGEPMPAAPGLPAPNEVAESFKRTPQVAVGQEVERLNDGLNGGGDGLERLDGQGDAFEPEPGLPLDAGVTP